MKKLSFIWALLFSVCVSYGCTHFSGPKIDNDHKKTNHEISFIISVRHTPNDVRAFGFDVFYDTTAIKYLKKYTKGDLTKNIEFFGVNEIKPGTIRVGGFTLKNNIKSGKTGSIVSLNFKVIGSRDTSLTIKNLVDDMRGWDIKEGTFSINGNVALSSL